MRFHIEYCEKWNYGPEFDRVSKIIKTVDSSIIVVGNELPPRSGAFEVSIDDKLVFSKLTSGKFPKESDINSWF